jgi:hypothetical protein
MKPHFLQLNLGWNAEPNAPDPQVEVLGRDIVLRFYVNPFQFEEFEEDEVGFHSGGTVGKHDSNSFLLTSPNLYWVSPHQ